MSELTNAQRAIKLREIELEIIALEEGRSGISFQLSELNQKSKAILPTPRGRTSKHYSQQRRRQARQLSFDWELAWENFDYILKVSTNRNSERFKAIGDAKAFLILEDLYRSLGDVALASNYADRAWAITTSLGYSAYRDGVRAETKNPFDDDRLRAWFEYGWNQRATRGASE